MQVLGQAYAAKREENHRLKVRSLPEEPLRNACVGELSVAENMALRDFDLPPLCLGGRLRFGTWRSRAREWITGYGIKTQSLAALGHRAGVPGRVGRLAPRSRPGGAHARGA